MTAAEKRERVVQLVAVMRQAQREIVMAEKQLEKKRAKLLGYENDFSEVINSPTETRT
mgnify:CR=1 FL=1